MRRPNALLVAVPAFLVGTLATATLTTTARGQLALPSDFRDVPPAKESVWEYKVVSEPELNVFGAQGFEYCGESAASFSNGVDRRYTLRKKK